ncbi:MAG: hypothetical protein K9M82_05335, partial [Deltaproteobacteria bacterium]|nr:hypothetical protein [Deltaproteobacteria bacterium]
AWDHLPPRVRSMESTKADYQERCGSCALRPLCMWCPALAHLETGELDRPVDCFCKVAQARTSLPENAPSARSR